MSTLLEAISICIQTLTPFVMWDKPGTGKTATIYAIAESLSCRKCGKGMHVITTIAAAHEPPDLAGWMHPVVQNGKPRLESLLGTDAQLLIDLRDEGHDVLWFLDEIGNAVPAMQGALLRPLAEKKIGQYDLAGISICAAANPASCGTEGWEPRPPFANRLVHFQWTLEADTWCQGMISGFPNPTVQRLGKDWRNGLPQKRALIASWINANKSNLHTMSDSNCNGAFASPRTLDMAALLLTATASMGIPDTAPLPMALVAGCIGEGPTLEFLNFVKEVDLGDPEEFLKAPSKFKLPNRSDRTFAMLSSIIALALSKSEGSKLQEKMNGEEFMKWKWMQAWKVIGECCKQGGTDLAAVVAFLLARPEGMPKDLQMSEMPTEVDMFRQLFKDVGSL